MHLQRNRWMDLNLLIEVFSDPLPPHLLAPGKLRQFLQQIITSQALCLSRSLLWQFRLPLHARVGHE